MLKQFYFIGTRNAVKVSLDFGYVWGKIPPGKRLKWHFRASRFRLDFALSVLSQLPRLSEKSGYGPDTMMLFNEKERCQCRIAFIAL